MKACIKPYNHSSEYLTEENCYITELSNTDDDVDVSIAQARIEPGVTTRWHRLIDTSERYIITAGTGLVEIGTMPATTVNVGDVVLIPPMCQQRITNTGSQDLVFLAICSPRFYTHNYQDTESDT